MFGFLFGVVVGAVVWKLYGLQIEAYLVQAWNKATRK